MKYLLLFCSREITRNKIFLRFGVMPFWSVYFKVRQPRSNESIQRKYKHIRCFS